MESRFFTMLGFATRSGNVVSGETGVLSAITNRKASLVLIAADASHNSKERFSHACKVRNIKMVEIGTKEQLGHAIGKQERSSVAIKSQEFAKLLLDSLGERSPM